MRWAAYCRVSTDEQARKGMGLDVQRETIQHWLPRGDELVEFYVDDGYSGAREDRPALQRMLRDAAAKRFDGVVVPKTDRLARSIKLIVKLALDVFEQLGLVFVSVTEPYDTRTPPGRLFFAQLAGFADFERELIRERTIAGRTRSAKQGRWLTWNPPFGYRRANTKQLMIDPEEQTVYDQMVRWALEDKIGCHAIAHRLNLRKVPSRYLRYGKSVQGKTAGFHWGYGTVHRILTNPVYAGSYQFQDTTIQVPALISPERWQAIQDQLQENWKHRPLRKTKNRYLLQGILYCGRCGRRMYGVSKANFRCPRAACRHRLNAELVNGQLPECCGKCHRPLHGACWQNVTRLYRCWTQTNREMPWEGGRCTLPSIGIDALEAEVWTFIRQLAQDSSKLKQALQTAQQAAYVDDVELRAQVTDLEKLIQQKDQRIDALLDSRELIAKREYVTRNVDRLHLEKEQLAEERNRLSRKLGELERVKQSQRQVEQTWEHLAKNIDRLDEQGRFEFLHLVVSRILVRYDIECSEHQLEIKLKVELDWPNSSSVADKSRTLHDASRT